MKREIPDSPAIEMENLTKQYQEVLAVDKLNLTIQRGEIYGFLGRNGAGKTTTIRMLLGLIRPTEGRASIFGAPVDSERSTAVSYTGSLVETATAYSSLTVKENLEIRQRLIEADPREIEKVMSLLGISKLSNRRAGRLSLGNRQRLALAVALLGSPPLLVLDEPANGLDPAGIVEIRRLLRQLTEDQGITIFVSSHILSEVALLADRIGIIHNGRLKEEIDISQWNELRKPDGYIIRTDHNDKACSLLERYLSSEQLKLENGEIIVSSKEINPSILAAEIVQSGIGLTALIPRMEDLETRFLKITGENI